MLYISGVDLPNNKSVKIALKLIYGFGDKISQDICNNLGITPFYKVKQLKNKRLKILSSIIKQYIINIELKKNIGSNIGILKTINSYRGVRHNLGLPVRGQRTRSNAKTQKLISMIPSKKKKLNFKIKISKLDRKKNIISKKK
jgi:small subunit ribosomal protein S13